VPYVKGWANLGFKWIGGCCRVRPKQIKAICDELHEKTAQGIFTKYILVVYFGVILAF